MADEILCSIQDGIATLTLNRPEKRNAINQAMMESLTAHFIDLSSTATSVWSSYAALGRCFARDATCARWVSSKTPKGQYARVWSNSFTSSRHYVIPPLPWCTVTLAGGCEMALHCDLRVAADVARFGMPLARLGLMVPFELTCKLIEVIGTAFTRQFLLTAQPIDATRAYDIGLVHQVVPAADLEPATYTMARAIAGNAPLALQGIKTAIQRALSLREQIAHADLDALIERTRHSADAREGVRAWLEKRQPIFRGE